MRLFLVSTLILCLGTPLLSAKEEFLDRVVAVVNDEIITQSELDMLLHPVYLAYQKEYYGEALMEKVADARRKLLNQLIEDRLVYQEAVSRGIEVNAQDITREMEAFKARLDHPSKMDELLTEEGMTQHDFRMKLKRQALIRRLHDMEIRSRIVVSPFEIEDYYKRNIEDFSTKPRVRIRSLTIKKSEQAKSKGMMDEEAKEKIEDFRKRALKGEDFEEMVTLYSEDVHAKEGGVGRWIEKEEMIEAIDQAIFKAKEGEITDIIETPIGYHLFRIEAKEKGQQKALAQMRDQIFMMLFHEKSSKRFEEWMEDLKRNAYISIR